MNTRRGALGGRNLIGARVAQFRNVTPNDLLDFKL